MHKRKNKIDIKNMIINTLCAEMQIIGHDVELGRCAPYYFWVRSVNTHKYQFLVSWYDDILRVQERVDSMFCECKSTTYVSRFEVNPADPDAITRFFEFFRGLNANTIH